MDFNKLFQITDDTKLTLSDEMKELLNKELCLGMTRWVCRHGTLGDGFEKLTDAQKYYQAVKEVWTRANELKRVRANAKKSYADFLEAKAKLEKAQTEIEILRATAEVELSELSALELLAHAEDVLRQLDEFNNVRLELQERVRAQYPGGIEQAEPDSWRTVMKYRLLKTGVPGALNDTTSVPLPFEEKFRIATEIKDRPDLAAPLLLSNLEKAQEIGGELAKISNERVEG